MSIEHRVKVEQLEKRVEELEKIVAALSAQLASRETLKLKKNG